MLLFFMHIEPRVQVINFYLAANCYKIDQKELSQHRNKCYL